MERGRARAPKTQNLGPIQPLVEADGWDKIEIDGGCSAAFYSRCYRR
jgi:hypothetical protein